jgi:hypothetical protein
VAALVDQDVFKPPVTQRAFLQVATVGEALWNPDARAERCTGRRVRCAVEYADSAATDAERRTRVGEQRARERDCGRGVREQRDTRVRAEAGQQRAEARAGTFVHLRNVLARLRRVVDCAPAVRRDLREVCLQRLGGARARVQLGRRLRMRLRSFSGAHSHPSSGGHGSTTLQFLHESHQR